MRKTITKTQAKECLEILGKYKHLVGFGTWDIVLNTDFCIGEQYAQCESNIYEQSLTVELNEDFVSLDIDRQRSILVHELIHGRYNAFEKVVTELTEFEEEKMINDLERGFRCLIEELDKK